LIYEHPVFGHEAIMHKTRTSSYTLAKA
jgi:hypothetical protein